MTLRLIDFVLTHLPPAPAHVLEVGCGEGELARGLDAAGYDVTAIDPIAPEGRIFRRIKLEELESEAQFDAVVAARSFHHMPNLESNLDKVALLAPLLVLDEFAWDRFDEATADWYEGQRRILLASGRHPHGAAVNEWEAHHSGLHGFDALRAALTERFVEQQFDWVPYLWRYLGGPVTAELEETLIEAGAIRPLGFRFVGIPKAVSTLDL